MTVRIEPLRPGHRRALLALLREPQVRRYLLDDIIVDADWVDGEIAASQGRDAAGGLGLSVALDDETGAAAIGMVGFRPFGEPPELQLIYALAPRATGRGLATELAGVALARAFADPARELVVASVDAANLASRRVLDRLGFAPVAAPGPTLRLILPRTRWRAT